MNAWFQTVSGKAIDLANPDPALIDFKDIAIHLSNSNRYAGATYVNISVAQHTLIVAGSVDKSLRPYALLYDAHEAYMGDIITPTVKALSILAARRARRAGHAEPVLCGRVLPDFIHELKENLDQAIYTAAGLPPPSEAQKKAIHQADLVALRTEYRDFLSECRGDVKTIWGRHFQDIQPLTRRIKRANPLDTSAELYALFGRYLPALKNGEFYD